MANTNTGNRVVNVLDDVNEILSKLVPIVPNVMGLIGLFLKRPDVSPEMRAQAIATMRQNFTTVVVESERWLEENGYNPDGTKRA